MEVLKFQFPGHGEPATDRAPNLTGVVGSGNLEVLVEGKKLDGKCEAVVRTSIQGFGATWERVLEQFFRRHPLNNVSVTINDAGATPAVATLRLNQAAAEFLEYR